MNSPQQRVWSRPWQLASILLLGSLGVFGCRTEGGAAALSAAEAPQQISPPVAAQPVSGFVQPLGTQFVLDGKPFYFEGTNFYRLGLRDIPFTQHQLDDILHKLSGAGLNVIRLWGFSCETPPAWAAQGLFPAGTTNPPILNAHGQANEPALAYLDSVIAKAGQNGLRVILPLVNFEPAYCGMEWWNHVYGTAVESKQGFYCNPAVKSAFKSYVSMMLTAPTRSPACSYKNDPPSSISKWRTSPTPPTVTSGAPSIKAARASPTAAQVPSSTSGSAR